MNNNITSCDSQQQRNIYLKKYRAIVFIVPLAMWTIGIKYCWQLMNQTNCFFLCQQPTTTIIYNIYNTRTHTIFQQLNLERWIVLFSQWNIFCFVLFSKHFHNIFLMFSANFFFQMNRNQLIELRHWTSWR